MMLLMDVQWPLRHPDCGVELCCVVVLEDRCEVLAALAAGLKCMRQTVFVWLLL